MGRGGSNPAALAVRDRPPTLLRIAAGSKLFFGNVIKRLIGKTDYVRTPKTPPRLHLIRGNPSKRPVKTPKKPLKRTKKVSLKFRSIWGAGEVLVQANGGRAECGRDISQLDARALELLVEAYTEYRITAKHSMLRGIPTARKRRMGCDDQGTSGCGDEGGCLEADRAMLAEFGMSPASRAKVNIADRMMLIRWQSF